MTSVKDVGLEVLTGEDDTSVVVADPAEFVGVNVDVEKTVDSCCEDVGVTTTEDVSSVTDGWVVSEVAVVVVVDGWSVVMVLFDACRLNKAMASSRGSAATNDARKMAKAQKRIMERMLKYQLEMC